MILAGEKQVLKQDEVRRTETPSFNEITVKKLYELVSGDLQVMSYLPTWKGFKPRHQPEKDFVWSIIATLRPEFAYSLVQSATTQRD